MLGNEQISRRTLLRGLGVAAAVAPFGLTACSSGPQAEPGSLLRVSQTKDPSTLDPQVQGGLDSMNVLINLFDTLTMRDSDNKLQPRLALSWQAVDEHTWRFVLRPGVKFHNGEDFNAEVVKFSIERLIDPATKSTIVELRYVTSVNIIDDFTVDIISSTPDPVLPEKVSLFGGVMVPPGYIGEVGSKGFAAKPIGTGPYKFVSWRKDYRIELVANHEHWNGKPAFEQLQFIPMPNAASALASLQSNGIDLVAGLTPEAALQLSGYAGVEIASFPGIRMNFVVLNTLDPVLGDVRVRRALNHAVDVPLLIEAVLDNHAKEAPTIVPREAFGFDESVPPFERSVDKARQLLTEAGHRDGVTLSFTASNADSLICQALAGQLEKAGFTIELNLLEPGTYSTRLASDDQAALGSMYLTGSTGWTLDGEATMQSYIRSDRKRSRIKDAEADRLIDVLEQKVDPQVRLKAFGEMQRLLHEEAFFLYLYQADLLYATNNLAEWRPNVVGTLAMDTATVKHG